MPGPLDQRQLDALRADADRFIAELDEEAYLHFAGIKDTYDLVPIYERHAELTKLDTALAIGASINGGRNTRELWRFACEGYLGNFVNQEQEKLAELEASLKATVDGEEVPYRNIRPAIANSEERSRRERLERARNELTEEHLNPLYLRSTQVVHRETERLGAPNYTELYRGFAFPLASLADQCRAFLDSTERLWEDAGNRFFRSRVGLGLGEVERWDVARVWRGLTWDAAFPKERMVPALEATLADLGVDLHAQRNVELDLEDRPNKTPRAFCVAIEIPERVILVIKPQGGPDDWRALFHEAGHTEHFAHTSPSLTMEEKRLGDNAVTEGWAMLLEHLTIDPAWLERRVGLPRPPHARPPGAAPRVRRGGRDTTALARPPLLREAPVRDRVSRGARCHRHAAALRGASERRAEGDAERHGLSRRHRRRLLRVAVPACVGVRVAVARVPAREVR